ncbi:alpha/beta-hydrolase [Microthyrium microscopicum]|uniref:Alpha/beta-hydrolase n=1 Tax=Microthyrium microscopicum TaxID=703497 RepID=A0A6A6UIS0_9PEZI|nr:alpha/beta-hydrolase [Microthyrium microscopicum]
MESEPATASPQSPTPDFPAQHPVETLTLKDGRTLAYAKYGATANPKTYPILYFNGTPGSHLECQLLDRPAQALGIPLIATDRPGFGASSFQENRTLLNWPQDVLELANHLDIEKFSVLGLSGGGPYVLACLHELPRERLLSATVASGMYPRALGTTGMMWQTRALFTVAGMSTWLAEKMIDKSMGSALRNLGKEKLKESMKAQAKVLPQPQADKDCMEQVLKDDVLFGAYIGSSKEALRLGSRGAAWEFYLLGSEWGFRLEDLEASRLTIWHGDVDVNVPVGMPDKAFELLPEAEYRRMKGEGHMSLIVKHRDSILSYLIAKS